MMYFSKNYLYLLLVFLMAGCGEFTYKRGASIRDLEQTKQACKYASEASIDQCLEKNGWYVQKLDDVDLFATASVSDNRSSQPMLVDVKNEQPNINEKTENKSEISNTIANKEDTSVVSKKLEPSKNSDQVINKPPVVAQAKPKQEVKNSADPYQTYKISSWWKMGSSDAMLRKHLAECSEKLGESHAPDIAKQTYTRALVVCMHEKGWKGLRAYK